MCQLAGQRMIQESVIVTYCITGETIETTILFEWNSPKNIETLEQGELFDQPADEWLRNPGDYEAMVGQGSIVVHAKNGVTSDKGVAMFRNRLRKDIRAFQQGQKSLQPGQLGPMSIPTWSGDTVLQIFIKMDPW